MLIDSVNGAPSPVAIGADVLEALREGGRHHMDHYSGHRLPYACLSAHGLRQRMVKLDGPDAGRVLEVTDASGGYASACLGAGHSAALEAFQHVYPRSGYVTDQVGSLERASFLRAVCGQGGLWADHFPSDEYHVSGRNSGSEGVELALRLVLESIWDARRLAPRAGREGRRTILAFEGAWHGWTAATQALVNRRHYRVGLPDALAEGQYGVRVMFLPFGDREALDGFFREHGATLAAVFVEPIQGDAGILVPPNGYLRHLAGLCRSHDALLVSDEVLTFAKTGRFFAMADGDGPIPTDVTVIGKSLGLGVMPVSMVIARRHLAVRSSGAVATNDLRPLACGLMLAGLREMVDGSLLTRSATLGKELRLRLQEEVVDPHPDVFREVRGLGYLNGIELTEHASVAVPRFRALLIENGVFAEFMAGAGRRSCGHRYLFPALRIAPPLIADRDDLGVIVEGICAATATFQEELK